MDILNIGLIQTDVLWEAPQQNRLRLEEKIRTLASQKANLILLPEMFNTGFSMNTDVSAEGMDGETVSWMKSLSEELKVYILGTLAIKEGDKVYNRSLISGPGNKIFAYDKHHLFSHGDENKHFHAGEKGLIFPLSGWNIRPVTCYDLRFPVWLKNTFENESYGYDILICSANWPHSRNYQWRQLLIARAIENQSFVVGVNRIGSDGNGYEYSGNSLAADPVGKLLFESTENKEESVIIQLKKEDLIAYRERMTVGRDWDKFEIKG